jgi:hypothetical protein
MLLAVPVTEITIMMMMMMIGQEDAFAKNQVPTTTANIHPIAPMIGKSNVTCNDISGRVNNVGVSGPIYDPRTGTTMPIIGSISASGSGG